ncbi:MAG: hypothetical protein J5659_07785 [Clostridia bacterium]|nr:hypothetical protein [Clostridia bacterium]
MNNNNGKNNEFIEDISSSSRKSKLKLNIELKDPVDLYGKLIYNNLGKTLKTIAYIVAIATILLGFGAAFLIFKKEATYIALSFAMVLVFTAVAAVEFFVIYGLGHSIQQNNEILKRLAGV